MPNQVFAKLEHSEDNSQSPGLYRLLLDARNLTESFKVHIRLGRETEAITEWRQLSAELIIVQQKTAVTTARIDRNANQETLSIVEICGLSQGMVLVPDFDPDCLPLELSWHQEGYYVLSDSRDRGWKGAIEGLDDVEVLGQPPQRPEWLFVKTRKTGAFCIVKMKKIQ